MYLILYIFMLFDIMLSNCSQKGVFQNEMKLIESGFRPPLCTYRLNWAMVDGEMNEMTLYSRHRIRNSSPGGLRANTLPFGHGGSLQYWVSHVDGEETFLFLSNRLNREPNPELQRESSGANDYPRAPSRTITAPDGPMCFQFFTSEMNFRIEFMRVFIHLP